VGEFPHIFFQLLAAAIRRIRHPSTRWFTGIIRRAALHAGLRHRRRGLRDRPRIKVRIDRPDNAPGRGVAANVS